MRTDSLYLQRLADTVGLSRRGHRLAEAAIVLVDCRFAPETGRRMSDRVSSDIRMLRP